MRRQDVHLPDKRSLYGIGRTWLLLLMCCIAYGQWGYSPRFHITDFGANQWRSDLQTGDDFSRAANRVYSVIPAAGQILVVQPPNFELDASSDAELAEAAYLAIKARVAAGKDAGQEEFEIQLIENIDILKSENGEEGGSYFNKTQQERAIRFGAAAYQAIGQVIAELRDEGGNPTAKGVAGSNGAHVAARNAEHIGFLDYIAIYDGRAFSDDVEKLIQALGGTGEKVSIFNTSGDAPGLGKSVAVWETNKKLKQKHPGLHLYFLDLPGRPSIIAAGHVAGMRAENDDKSFKIKEWDGEKATVPEDIKGRDLRRREDDSQQEEKATDPELPAISDDDDDPLPGPSFPLGGGGDDGGGGGGSSNESPPGGTLTLPGGVKMTIPIDSTLLRNDSVSSVNSRADSIRQSRTAVDRLVWPPDSQRGRQ